MPVWTVQLPDGEDDRIEAGMMATEGGALVAFSEEGDLLGAWAPGSWRTARAQTPERPRRRAEVLLGVP